MSHPRTPRDKDIAKIIDFASRIGLPVKEIAHHKTARHRTPVPGIYLEAGRVQFYRPLVLSPGDLLHELGHVAVMPSRWRHLMNADLDAEYGSFMEIGHRAALEALDIGKVGPVPDNPYWHWLHADESAAIAWSYAAARHLKIDPLSVFHGRRGAYGGKAEATNMALAALRDCASLHHGGMTSKKLFPKMIRWVQI